MKATYNKEPIQKIQGTNKEIAIFSTEGENIDAKVVKDFGDEWSKFNDFNKNDIDLIADMYFDILNEKMINAQTYAIDIGCGSGRWTKFLSEKVGFIEAIDPSNAVFAADNLLKDVYNVRISKASVETIPFDDETFDFAMSVGVLHHIPDTQRAMIDCVKKVKKQGYFFVYLYYNLETRGSIFKSLFKISDIVRNVVCKMPAGLKKITCDFLAITTYMPFIITGRIANKLGFKKIASNIPLNDYQNTSFFIIRNDALDRYGTTFDQRFSKEEVINMMKNSGLEEIVVSPAGPYYHAVGKKI